MKIFPALPRLLAGVAAAALLTSACSTTVPGEPTPGAASPSAQAAPAPDSGPSASGCEVRASSSGSISSSGAGGRTVTTNGRTSFSCGSGPLIAIEAIDGSGVTFSADGATATVAPGSAAAVGPYRITVGSVDGGAAEFEVEPAG
ncbi:hypothetical protein [Pseudonocardia kunmingensis]|uniref:hypothetical protein n=1 Tax=Pseudonocardia kunmingensis TaxID=630975 RepID=UPI001478D785|nr:hypothetical protein [Pseudonocardia kunmingensis]